MRYHKKGVFAFRPTHGKIIADFERGFRVHFTGNKGLPDLIAQNVGVLFQFPSRDGFVI